jgi:DNA-binding transcriptional regulator YiaG
MAYLNTRTQTSTLAQDIKTLRLQLGLTQTQFAVKLGVSFPSVNRWENGKVKPSALAFKQLQRLAKRQGMMLG